MAMERVWFDITELPSGGKVYPEDWKISITPYSFGDILNLSRAMETGINALDKIIAGVKCNFDKELLLPADVIYLGIYRKLVSTKHSKIEFKVECPACMKENKKVVELQELQFKEVKVPEFPIVAELETGTLEFVPINLKNYKIVAKKYNADPAWTLAHCVQNMEPAAARDIIVNAIDLDKEILDEVTELMDFGLKPIEFECQDEFCDQMISVQLEDPTTIVFPFREDGRSAKDRIKFGSKSPSESSGDTKSGS